MDDVRFSAQIVLVLEFLHKDVVPDRSQRTCFFDEATSSWEICSVKLLQTWRWSRGDGLRPVGGAREEDEPRGHGGVRLSEV